MKQKPKYLLLYSRQFDIAYGSNSIKTVEGKIVRYTNMTENHDWRPDYKWDDAVEVGFAESYDDIVELGIKVSYGSNWYDWK